MPRRHPPLEPVTATTVVDGRMIVGRNIRTRRKAHGWSQEALAERTGLHWTYVGSVERAERNVSVDNICRFASALGAAPKDLFSEE